MCQMVHGQPECWRIIDVGSRKSGLQSETERIFEICVHHGISIESEWIDMDRFFLGGGALVSRSTSTPINHIVFFGRIPVALFPTQLYAVY